MIYLLSGKNCYLSWQELQVLKEEYLSKNSFGTVKIVDGETVRSLDELLSNTEMNSFFSSSNLLIIKRLFKNKSGKLIEQFTKIIGTKKDENIIFWEDGDIDKRTILFKNISKVASHKDFKELKSFQAKQWVENIFKEQNISVSNHILDILISRVGNNQFILQNEIKKLIYYIKSENRDTANAQDIKSLISKNREENIWEFIDEISNSHPGKALLMLENLLYDEYSYPLIMSLITRQLRILYLLIEYKNLSRQELATKTKLHPFVIKKNISTAQRFTLVKIRKAYEKLLGLDEKLKQGIISPKLGLDLFVLSFR